MRNLVPDCAISEVPCIKRLSEKMSPELSTFLYYLINASNFAVLPAVTVTLVRWRKLSIPQRWLGRLLIAVAAIQLTAVVLIWLFEQSNMPLYHLYIALEGPSLLLLYRYRLKHSPVARYLPWIAAAYLLVVLGNIEFQDGLSQLPSFPRSAEALMLSALALLYFRFVFLERKVMYLSKSFWFWLSSALLLYFSPNLMLFIFTNYIPETETDLFTGIWAIHGVFNFVLYILFSVALLCQDRESYSSF